MRDSGNRGIASKAKSWWSYSNNTEREDLLCRAGYSPKNAYPDKWSLEEVEEMAEMSWEKLPEDVREILLREIKWESPKRTPYPRATEREKNTTRERMGL